MTEFIKIYASFLIYALNIAILGRVVMSWISPNGNDPLSGILMRITEPILAPIRKVMPSTGMFDFAPMVALFILNFVVARVINGL